MAVGGNVGDFDIWLSDKLLAFNTDESVFGSYIRGILEGEESPDEKREALEVIISEMTNDNISKICQEMLEKWNLLSNGGANGHNTVLKAAEDVDVKLARLIEKQAQTTTVRNSSYTDEEKRIREAILTQYGQLSDDEGEADPHPHVVVAPAEPTKSHIERNTNALLVMQAEREKREKAKVDSQKKKDKDKEDREKQKQMQQEKKEKRKPQKGERRR